MLKDKLRKFFRVIGWIILIYIGLEIILRILNVFLNEPDFSSPYQPDKLKTHYYLISSIRIAILIFLSYITWRGIKRNKWLIYFIPILLIIVMPKIMTYLHFISYSSLHSKRADKKEVLYNDILQKQSVLLSSTDLVRFEKTYFFKWKNNKPKKKGILLSTKEYSTDKNLIRKNQTQYIYDSIGNIVKEIEPNIHDSFDTIWNRYNKKGLLIEKIDVTPKYIRKTCYKYDSLGNKLRHWSYFNNTLDFEFIYNYDDSLRVISQHYTDFDENRKTKELYEYIDNSKIQYVYSSDGSLFHKIIFKYDSSGNEIEQTIINNKGEKQSININEYNDKSQKTKYINIFDGKKSREQIWEYGSLGNMLRAIDYYGTGPLREIKYSYGNSNRLIEKKVFDLDSKDVIASEMIVYEAFE